MADVNISKFRASVVRDGSKPASPGFVVSEGQDPVDPAGSGQNHLPVTIAAAATGLAITESQVLGGAGTVGQYIRGDGSLADFPESSGGGSSISYYLNGSVSQGTIGGVAYKELNKVPILGAGTDFTINADGYIASFLTDAGDPNLLEIPGGNWTFETYFSASSGGGSPTFYVELYKYDGTTFTLIASNSTFPELIAFGTNIISYFSTLAVPTTALALTDRLAIRYYVTHSGRTITLHTEDNHLCQIITTFTTGITALNGLTAQVQNFAVGTSGTDFAIASATATHTFNLPTASATNRGALSSADWTTFNGKTSNLGTVTSVGLSSATSGVTIGSTPVTTSGTITLAIATASGSQNGLLSSTDWTTFNSKQNALTNPVTGTGSAGQIAYFTGTSAITSESGLVWDATNNNLSIGGATANSNLTVSGSDNTDIFTVLAGGNSRLHVGTITTGTIAYVRSQNNYSLNLGVNTTDYLSISNTGNSSFSGNIVLTNGANRFVRIGSASNYNYDLQTTGDDFQIIEAGTTLGGTPRLTIKYPNGNIGIGTTTPEIYGSGWGKAVGILAASGYSVIQVAGSSGNGGEIDFGSNTIRHAAIASLNGSNLSFYTNENNSGTTVTERMRISSGGSIGVNNTSPMNSAWGTDATTKQLSIDGSSYAVINLQGSTRKYSMGVGDGNFYMCYDNTAARHNLVVSSAGNVLINTTTSGSSKLRIVGLPTSSAGLSSGDVWSDSGTLKIA
jgi:hypothetical protein